MATGTRKRLLLVAATTGYQTKVFAEVGRRLGVDVSLATDRCHVLNDPWGDQAIPVRFEVLEESAAALAQGRNFDAVVAVGDRPAYLAAPTNSCWPRKRSPRSAKKCCAWQTGSSRVTNSGAWPPRQVTYLCW